MSDLLNEQRISLRELAEAEKIDLTTAWRWAKRGVRGVVLETVTIGGRRYTTREAYRRFAEGCTKVSNDGNPHQGPSQY